MKKELVIKQEQALQFLVEEQAFGTDEVSAADIRISRVLLAQKMSPITDKKELGISAGDLWDSVTETKILDAGEIFSFIPINIKKSLTTKHRVNGKFEFLRIDAWDVSFANKKYEENIDGVDYQFVKNIDILAIKEADLGDISALPVYITFRSSSYKCGQDIIASCLQAKAKGASSAQLTINVLTEISTNDKGSFYVFKKKPDTLTKDYANNAANFKRWFELVNSGKAIIDDESKLDAELRNEPFTAF